jgi:hypothetical protein
MTYPRKSLVSIKETPYYHCVARCVRRAWLWGVDEYAGKDYSHRKDWVIERLRELVSMFAIDCCAFAVMSNHYHLVVYVDAARAQHWSDDEVERHGTPTNETRDTHQSKRQICTKTTLTALEGGASAG